MAAAFFGLMVSAVPAIEMRLDFRHDPVFQSNQQAVAAIEAAAADISFAITSSLGAIEADSFTGQSGDTSATFDLQFIYRNPTSGLTETIDPTVIGADEIVVFVGAEPLSGGVLGSAGPGLALLDISAAGPPDNWAAAVDIAEELANQVLERGRGPIVGSLNGGPTYAGVESEFQLRFGFSHSDLSLDADKDNDGVMESAENLEDYWHFDHTTPVPPQKFDFYSVALHELMHAIGFGPSQTWDGFVAGTRWSGENVIEFLGTGRNVLHFDENHIAVGKMSTRISDGASQVAALAPDVPLGMRKSLTLLDLAFLRDLNFDTVIEVGSLGDLNNDGLFNVFDLDELTSEIATGSEETSFDINGDDVVDILDVDDWLAKAAKFNGFSMPYPKGDANLDGTVDASDLNVVAQRWQSAAFGWSNGDFIPDGSIDANDLNVLGQNWLARISPVTIAAVPEPNAVPCLFFCLTILTCRKTQLIRTVWSREQF
jgi:hypothetical protein